MRDMVFFVTVVLLPLVTETLTITLHVPDFNAFSDVPTARHTFEEVFITSIDIRAPFGTDNPANLTKRETVVVLKLNDFVVVTDTGGVIRRTVTVGISREVLAGKIRFIGEPTRFIVMMGSGAE
jgi:hypothetical protein